MALKTQEIYLKVLDLSDYKNTYHAKVGSRKKHMSCYLQIKFKGVKKAVELGKWTYMSMDLLDDVERLWGGKQDILYIKTEDPHLKGMYETKQTLFDYKERIELVHVNPNPRYCLTYDEMSQGLNNERLQRMGNYRKAGVI